MKLKYFFLNLAGWLLCYGAFAFENMTFKVNCWAAGDRFLCYFLMLFSGFLCWAMANTTFEKKEVSNG